MFKNYLKTALRNISRQKGYVFINILGLAIGIAGSMLIAIYIFSELSYDQHHANKDRIYRIYLEGRLNNQELKGANTAAPAAPAMKEKFPEVEDAVRVDGWGETVIKYKNKSFVEDAFMMADSTFFNVFTAPLIKGNPQTALVKPHTVVLTQSAKSRIFGDEEAIGKSLEVGSYEEPFEITAIMEDMPGNTHFRCNMIGSFVTDERSDEGQWLSNNIGSYLLLEENASKEDVEAKIPDLLREHASPILERFMGLNFDEFIEQGNAYAYHLQALTDIHLTPDITGDMKRPHDKRYIYIFAVVAFMLIVIAIINYMNLSTARAANRAKEVGLRKVTGANRRMIINQFLLESVIMSIMALVLAVLMVELTLPYFNNLINTHLTLNYIEHWYLAPVLLVLALLIGLLAGSYPSFYLSAFNPTIVLGGELKAGAKSKRIRSGLVIFQFIISAALILGTIVIWRQTNYMLNKELGFNKEQLAVIRRINVIGDEIVPFKKEIKNIPGVKNASHSTMVPGHPNNNNAYLIESRPQSETFLFESNWADPDFLDVYGIKLADGRFLEPRDSVTDNACLVNQKAVADYGLSDPFNEAVIQSYGDNETTTYQIVGIVDDFHIYSLHNAVRPYIIMPHPDNNQWGYLSIRLSGNNMRATMARIEETWNRFAPDEPMLYFFMDNEYASMYKEEQRSSKLALGFAFLSIFVASLGLFGLTSYTTEQRTKEIGIRKAMGSSVGNIVMLVARETFWMIMIALVISWPVAYYFLSNWLENYPYRISLGVVDFLLSFLIIIVVAAITVSYRTIKAAHQNPAWSLRYE